MEEHSPMPPALVFESEGYWGSWRMVTALDGFAMDRELHAAGWNFFFLAADIKVLFLGVRGTENIRKAVQRILTKVKRQHYNGLEITGIVAKRLLGVPYTTVSAHSRHIQQGCQLDGIEQRQAGVRDEEQARD
jgi:hypothetical protein